MIVVDRTDRSPLAGAIVWVRSHGRRVHTWTGTTDDRGRFTIVPPDEATQSFDITVGLHGYVPNGLLSGGAAADSSTVELEGAEPLGGAVRDEQGRPIAGAQVFTTAYPAALAWPEIAADPNGKLVMAMTDEQGRWRSDCAAGRERPGDPGSRDRVASRPRRRGVPHHRRPGPVVRERSDTQDGPFPLRHGP